jgi:hypothetical protein
MPARTAREVPTSMPQAWRIFTSFFVTDLKRAAALF